MVMKRLAEGQELVDCVWCPNVHHPDSAITKQHRASSERRIRIEKARAEKERARGGGLRVAKSPNRRCKYCPGTHRLDSSEWAACQARGVWRDAEFDLHVEMGVSIARGIRARRLAKGLPLDKGYPGIGGGGRPPASGQGVSGRGTPGGMGE